MLRHALDNLMSRSLCRGLLVGLLVSGALLGWAAGGAQAAGRVGALDPAWGGHIYELSPPGPVPATYGRPAPGVFIGVTGNETDPTVAIDAALLGNGSAVVAWVGDFSPGRLTLVNAAGSRADALGSSTVRVAGLLRQSDGSLLLAGNSVDYLGVPPLDTTALFVERHTAAGFVDSGFGVNGVARVPLPGSGWLAGGLASDAAGRVLVGGGTNVAANPNGVLGVARVTPGGTADSSFGINGATTIDRGLAHGRACGVMARPGGGAVLVGSAIPRGSTGRVGVLVGLRGNGSLDPRFAGGGVRTFHVGDSTSGCASATGDAAGRTYVAAGTSDGAGVLRFTASGAIDTRFGRRGLARIAFGSRLWAPRLQVLRDGRVLLAGENVEDAFALARLTRRGGLDATFGGGRACAPRPDIAYQNSLHALALATDRLNGALVAAGHEQADTPWLQMARIRPTFQARPIECTTATQSSTQRGKPITIRLILKAPARLTLVVYSNFGSIRIGSVGLGSRGKGLHTLRSNGRLHGHTVIPDETQIQLIARDRHGHLLATTDRIPVRLYSCARFVVNCPTSPEP
jgi:uncharacterized delta-60 repeat protein